MKGSRSRNPAPRRRTNQALLVLVPLAVLTGLVANMIGTDSLLDPATIHGVVALAVAVLTPWKAPIVRRGLGRHRNSRWTSLALLGLIASTLVSGLVHSAAIADRLGPLTIMQIHIGSALVALVLVVFHYRAHPVPIRTADLTRRSFISTASVGAAGALLWLGWEGAISVAGSRGANRRFTGSHERGSFDPDAMPVTSWFDDEVQHIEGRTWSMTIGARVVELAELESMPAEDVTALLDCTSGWYSQQVWTGVRLDRLIETDRRSIEVSSATGYGRRFPTRDLDRLWLVTQAGGRPLSAGHGFPARIVAPGRRGYWWVKWVTSIQPSDVPWWMQLPFPAT